MPRRSILSAAERASLLLPPDTEDELIRHYAFGETDLSLIRQRRGDANRLGVAVQLCLLRFPGQGLLPDASMPMSLLQWIGRQLRIDPSCWPQYAAREETRREHLLELRAYLGVEPFGLTHYRQAVLATTELALQTDKGTSSCRRWMSSSASAPRASHAPIGASTKPFSNHWRTRIATASTIC